MVHVPSRQLNSVDNGDCATHNKSALFSSFYSLVYIYVYVATTIVQLNHTLITQSTLCSSVLVTDIFWQ